MTRHKPCVSVCIPARFGSSRFPGKPLARLCGKPLIHHIYEAIQGVEEVGQVLVLTDHQEIYQTVKAFGGEVLMVTDPCRTGTDRVGKVAHLLKHEVVVNWQADEIPMHRDLLKDLVTPFLQSAAGMGTLKRALALPADVKIMSQTESAEMVENINITPGYWVATKEGYQCQIKLARDLQSRLGHQLQERLLVDWDLHHRLDYGEETVKRACQLILSRARQRGFTLLDLEREFTRAPELAAARARVLDRYTPTVAYDLDKAIESLLIQLRRLQLQSTRDLQLDEVMAKADTFIEAMAKVEGLATTRDKGAARELVKQLRYTLDHAQSLAQNRELVVYQELTRALMLALKHVRELVIILERAVMRARIRVRTTPLLHIVDLLSRLDHEQDERNLRLIRYALDDYGDFYLDFALLEERRLGQMPALEGIRLVKERS